MKGIVQTVKQFLQDCFFNHVSVKFHITNALIALAVIISASTMTLQLFIRSGELYDLSQKTNQIIVTLFTIEYIFRLLVAPKFWRYIFSWKGLIDLMAILPFYLYTAGFFQSFNLLLLTRNLRFLKFLEVDEIHFDIVARLNQKKQYGSFILRENEDLLFIARRSSWIFLIEMIFGISILNLGLLSLILLGTSWLGLIPASAFLLMASALCIRSWRNHHYNGIFITNQRLVIQEQDLFGSSESEIPYEFIIDVIPDNRGLWNVLFDIGSIFIESGTPQDDVGLKFIRQPKVVVEKIQAARKGHLPVYLRSIQGVKS